MDITCDSSWAPQEPSSSLHLGRQNGPGPAEDLKYGWNLKGKAEGETSYLLPGFLASPDSQHFPFVFSIPALHASLCPHNP